VLIHTSGFQSFPTKRVINKNIHFSFQDGGVCLRFVGYDAVLIPSPVDASLSFIAADCGCCYSNLKDMPA
jgi:hypothetical protein